MVTIREFQRKFCSLKDKVQEVFDSDGVKIGTWIPENGSSNTVGQPTVDAPKEIARKEMFNGLHDTVGQAFNPRVIDVGIEIEKNSNSNTVGRTLSPNELEGAKFLAEMTAQGIVACEKCLTIHADCYKIWEDGDERVVCVNCIKKVVPPKRLKSYLSRLEKIL